MENPIFKNWYDSLNEDKKLELMKEYNFKSLDSFITIRHLYYKVHTRNLKKELCEK